MNARQRRRLRRALTCCLTVDPGIACPPVAMLVKTTPPTVTIRLDLQGVERWVTELRATLGGAR